MNIDIMKIDKTVKVFEGAHIIGDVTIGKNSSVWYNAVLRGDRDSIKIGANTNIQDNCVIHCSDGFTTILKDNVSVGHGAILHGCEIEDNVIIGMNATVLNGAKIAKNSVVGAGAVVSENKTFPEKSLILGVPGKVVRSLTDIEVKGIERNASVYTQLAKEYSESR
ncbi:MAG: gamma carbonic anhydrase family protein [Methanobacteriaceae archaeon]